MPDCGHLSTLEQPAAWSTGWLGNVAWVTREQIAEIDAAIGRLGDGTYGTCVRCGQPVGEDRLAARPAAASCVRCARAGR